MKEKLESLQWDNGKVEKVGGQYWKNEMFIKKNSLF